MWMNALLELFGYLIECQPLIKFILFLFYDLKNIHNSQQECFDMSVFFKWGLPTYRAAQKDIILSKKYDRQLTWKLKRWSHKNLNQNYPF